MHIYFICCLYVLNVFNQKIVCMVYNNNVVINIIKTVTVYNLSFHHFNYDDY